MSPSYTHHQTSTVINSWLILFPVYTSLLPANSTCNFIFKCFNMLDLFLEKCSQKFAYNFQEFPLSLRPRLRISSWASSFGSGREKRFLKVFCMILQLTSVPCSMILVSPHLLLSLASICDIWVSQREKDKRIPKEAELPPSFLPSPVLQGDLFFFEMDELNDVTMTYLDVKTKKSRTSNNREHY